MNSKQTAIPVQIFVYSTEHACIVDRDCYMFKNTLESDAVQMTRVQMTSNTGALSVQEGCSCVQARRVGIKSR